MTTVETLVEMEHEVTRIQAVEKSHLVEQNNASDPPPYSKNPTKEELTIEKSECWREGRRLFTDRLANGKDLDKADIDKFFKKISTLQKTIDRCAEIQADAARRSDSVGTLSDVLSSFKSVGDVVLSSAPEAIGAVWFVIGFVIKVVADDAETCEIVANVYNQVAKIAIACLLYEERCSHRGPGDAGDGNLVALEKVIVDNIANLVCEILDFFWNTQRWAVKLKSNSTELERNEGPAELRLNRAPTMREESGPKPKTKGIGHAMKAAMKKGGEAIKDSVKSGIDSVKNARDTLIEALTGELKEKAQTILELYKGLHADGTIQFEQTLLDGIQNLNEDVQHHLKDFKTGLDSYLSSLKDSMHRIEERQADTLEVVQDTNEKAANLLEAQRETNERLKQLQETKRLQMFESYINCFQRSLAHENLIQTLYTKKQQDGAADDRSWLLQQRKYKDWKTCSPKSSRILCLEAKSGHGKTMTMLSVTSDLGRYRREEGGPDPESTFVLRFFFKLGDNELQSTLRALESLLRQLLKKFSDESESKTPLDEKVKQICEVLVRNKIEKIQAEVAKAKEGVTVETKEPGLISKMISEISAILNLRLYIILDALDECHDLKDSSLVRCLKDLAYSEGSDIRIIVSTRGTSQDNVGIRSEFQQNGITLNPLTVRRSDPSADIVTLTNKENTSELQLYLELKLRDLVSRRVGKLKVTGTATKSEAEGHANMGAAKEIVDEKQVDDKVKVLAENISEIVKGDFSYAGMLIANLQEPSKKRLEDRIKELEGSGAADMYRRNLDVLTPGKRTLILFALKWVVWSVSDVTAVEIAEHFREVYHNTKEAEEELNSTQANYDPSDDPEIREIISHLRTAGHDFFSFSSDNDPVTAHTSVREWIQKGENRPVDLRSSQARLVKSEGGRLFFEIAVLSDSIPKDYNELSELMSEEESQLSIASDILRALTSKSFQNRYMPWNPPKEYEEFWNEKVPQLKPSDGNTEDDNSSESNQKNQDSKDPKRQRYEIRHWVDHIKALEKYMSRLPEQAENTKWNTLGSLLGKFTKPENWYRWHIKRRVMGGHREVWAYSQRCYQEPIHAASLLGIRLLIDYLYRSTKNEDDLVNPDPEAGSVIDRYDGVGRLPLSLAIRDPTTVEYLLKTGAKVNKKLTDNSDDTVLRDAINETRKEKEMLVMGNILESIKLLLKYGAKTQLSDALKWIVPRSVDEEFTSENAAELQSKFSELTTIILKLLEKNEDEKQLVDVDSIFLSAMEEIASCPSQAQAIWNRAESLLTLEEKAVKSEGDQSVTPLHILVRAVYDHPDYAETLIPMIRLLLEKGADPLANYTGDRSNSYFGNPVLLAVQTRNPKLFDIFCQREGNLLQSKALSGASAMHYFFRGKHKSMSDEDKKIFEQLIALPPPSETTNETSGNPETENITETPEKEGRKIPYLVGAEDNDSREPLSWAIEYGDKDGVKLLLKYMSSPNDVDELDQTGLYYLADSRGDPVDSIAILQDLHEAGANMRISPSNGMTVFSQAVYRQSSSVLREFVRILPRMESKPESVHEESGKGSGKIDGGYLLRVGGGGENFLHRAAEREDGNEVDISDVLEEVIQSLTEDDQKTLLSQEDESAKTPLILAVSNLNFPLIRLLLKYQPAERETPVENSKNPLRIIGMNIKELETLISKAQDREEIEGDKKNSQLNSTQAEGSASSGPGKRSNPIDYEQTMVEILSASDIDTKDTWLMQLRDFAIRRSWSSFLQNLEERGVNLETPDEYGWNAFHLARYFGTVSSLFRNGDELETQPPQPSKLQIDPSSSTDITISEDGLEVTPGNLMMLLADRPIDRSSGRYYFEVQVKETTQTWSKYWSLGIMPAPLEDKSRACQVGVMIGLGWHGDDGSIRDKIDPSEYTKPSATLPKWGQGDDSKEMDIVGLGIDFETGSVFFTKNGELVGIVKIQIHYRFIPALSIPKESTARVNFGNEEFKFKDWEGSIKDIETVAKGSGHMSD